MAVNFVNTYFANIGKDLADKISTSLPITMRPCDASSCVNSMVLLGVTEEDVTNIIRNLRGDCAVGWDGIPAKLIKLTCSTLSPIITYICNLAISTGKFPNSFKKAIVHPVYKSGERDRVSNFRPISVLPVLSKILETILNRALTSFLEANNLISDSQFGFRKNRSTEDAVGALVEHVTAEVDFKKKCLGIFLDLSKAFDTVSIPLLLNKLENIGVRGHVLAIFRDYLLNRTQSTKIDTYISNELFLAYGVPQGSILGPTLFNIYINELCNTSLKHCRIFGYADDTALVISGQNWSDTIKLAENSLRIVMKWLIDNRLTLNLDKTKFITFSSRPSAQPPQDLINIKAHTCSNDDLACDCFHINRTDNMRYLGVLIDKCLSWYDHVQQAVGRIRKLIFIFKCLRNSADSNILHTVYTSLCESLLIYCIPIWGGSCKSNFINIERAQRAVLKVMYRKPFRYPTRNLFAEAGVLTVRQLFILRTVVRQQGKLTPRQPSPPRRRRKPAFETLRCNTTFARRQLTAIGRRLYNKINRDIRIDNLNKFECKKKIKCWLKNLDYEETENMLLV